MFQGLACQNPRPRKTHFNDLRPRNRTDTDLEGMRLVVFSDDWGRHPSSCQHLVRRLAGRHTVRWVNTVGMRRVRFCMADVQRGLGWLKRSSGSKEQTHVERSGTSAEVSVVSPWMWPGFGWRWQRQVNAQSMSRVLGDAGAGVTTLPILADVVARDDRSRRWVYYCVDDFSVWPGMDGKMMSRMERELVDHVDAVVAVSQVLCDKMRSQGRSDVVLLEHGVDLERWRQDERELTGDRTDAPMAMFWGLLDERLDVHWCRALGRAMRQLGGKLVLVGPGDVHALRDAPGVEFRGAVSYDALPAVACEADVLVMPYRAIPVTHAMQPLKFKEYLATGLPVVGRALAGVSRWSAAADLVHDPQAFVAAVLQRLAMGLDAKQRAARQRLRTESWDVKARVLEHVIRGHADSFQPRSGREPLRSRAA